MKKSLKMIIAAVILAAATALSAGVAIAQSADNWGMLTVRLCGSYSLADNGYRCLDEKIYVAKVRVDATVEYGVIRDDFYNRLGMIEIQFRSASNPGLKIVYNHYFGGVFSINGADVKGREISDGIYELDLTKYASDIYIWGYQVNFNFECIEFLFREDDDLQTGNDVVSYSSVAGYPVPEAVDLGLSVKWATCNLGAASPEEYGEYYAWGETETKTDYDWGTYKWCKGAYNKLTKYCPSDESGFWAGYGSPDGKTSLDLSDDVAHIKLGGKWRMPTDAEWTELRERCKWTLTRTNSAYGCKVTGPNGNSIFLPAACYRDGTLLIGAGSNGYYWSSSLGTVNHARYVDFNTIIDYMDYDNRCYGLSVRPVSE